MPGTLYLIPVPIIEGDGAHTTTPEVISVSRKLQYYVVENARTARRILRVWHPHLILESIEMLEIDKHEGVDMSTLRRWLREGREVGLMSEAGCPAVADPGSEIVAAAHEAGAVVKPLTGPSSLMLALMASGLNGQGFAFWGYLPIKEPTRGARIKELELLSKKHNQTQIFIETPYRNDAMLADLLKHLTSATRLCIAQHITSPDEWIKTMTVADWKKEKPALAKVPTVFLMLA
jgi:16S rRNA (cytidine1402-2'-O)-methyltransferase